MTDTCKQYYVAVSDERMKLPTLVDLLNALLVTSPIRILVSCSSRDSLDTVAASIPGSVPSAEFTFLHANLKAQEVEAAFSSLSEQQAEAREVLHESESAAANSHAPEVSVGSSVRDRLHEAVEGTSPPALAHPQDSGHRGADLGQVGLDDGVAKETVRAKILAMTDVLFKSIDAATFPHELMLLINFDLPLQKDYYARQVELLSGHKDSARSGIVIHFVVAGQIADFRLLESRSSSPIDVMPVHVEDVFQQQN